MFLSPIIVSLCLFLDSVQGDRDGPSRSSCTQDSACDSPHHWLTSTGPQLIVARQATTTTATATTSTTSTTSTASTSSAPLPSTSPGANIFVNFHVPVELTTCTSALISWDYAGPSNATISISITTGSSSPPPSSTSSASSSPSSSAVTSPTTSTGVRRLRRQNANITHFIASVNASSFNYTWQQVNVPPGVYLYQASISTSDTKFAEIFVSSRFSVSGGSDTSCLIATTFPPPSATASGAPEVMPTPSLSPTQVGAIVGGVVGGVTALTLLCLGLMHVRKRRFARSHGGGWGGLRSTDSQKSFNDPPPSVAAHTLRAHTSSGSLSANGKLTRGSLEENATRDREKVTEAPAYNHRRASSYSSVTQNNDGFNPYNFPTREGGRSRANTLNSTPAPHSAHTFPSQHYSGNTSPTSPTRRDKDIFAAHTDHPVELSPISATEKGASRRSRTSRKPVPKYDTAEEVNMTPASSYNNGSVLDHNGSPAALGLLGSEATFSQKPVHYLIPDPPTSQGR